VSRTLYLYQLQTLDSEIDKAKQELAEIAGRLGESQALQEARRQADAADKKLRQARTGMQDLDLEVKSLTTKIEQEEKRLYSGRVLNAKEAANLQEEVASLKRRQSDREEHLLEAMVDVEESEAAFQDAQATLTAVEADWQANQNQLSQRQAALNRTLSELLQRRPTVLAPLSQADIKEYENLRAKKAGRAVAAVKNNICQGCGTIASNSQLQRARTGTELTYCTTCGRIFYIS
jgi:hypothetical protein